MKVVVIILRIIGALVLVALLTATTQVGGIVLLLALLFYAMMAHKVQGAGRRLIIQATLFVMLYAATTLVVVPWLAPLFGRVALPLMEIGNVRPLSVWTCLLNRHYVKKPLAEATFAVAERMGKAYPGTAVRYLDAGFPFYDRFPLLPHRSHNDGKKLDLAFFYQDDASTGLPSNAAPSPIGYGVYVQPKPGEADMPLACEQKGYWQYSVLQRFVPQGGGAQLTFDELRTKALVTYYAEAPAIGKVFIEPHLKQRLALESAKVRYHGCAAVRHDDHVHVQLR